MLGDSCCHVPSGRGTLSLSHTHNEEILWLFVLNNSVLHSLSKKKKKKFYPKHFTNLHVTHRHKVEYAA